MQKTENMFLRSIIICSVIYLVHSKSNKTCNTYLRELADGHMHFVQCVVVHSVPVTVCNSCEDYHTNFSKLYDLLLAKCSNTYFDKDRINLIASTESVLTGLWTKAYCDDCFNNNNSGVFYEKNNALNDCLDHNKEDPCEECKSQYLDLNNFYINLDQHNNGEVCFDFQDSMNRTRNKWSKELNCCRREKNLTLFITVLAITSFLPLLFYGTTFCITKRQERFQRILFNEDPYNSDVPSSTHRNIVNINNPTQSMLENHPSTSNAGATNAADRTPLSSNDKNDFYSNKYIDSSDDEMLINSTTPSKEKIKNI